MSNQDAQTFASFGKSFQEKTCQSIIQDHTFSDQMYDILDPCFFELTYLEKVTEILFNYKRQYNTYPSPEVIEIIAAEDLAGDRDLLLSQIKDYLALIKDKPLNGDTGFIQSSSLDFCRRQTLKEAMVKAIDKIEESDYDSISTIVREALNKGGSRDFGHEYLEGFALRNVQSIRKPVPTGWAVLDKEFNGGWERRTLTTFIAPTGAGKSMFLVNCGAAAITQGLNVLYITCEMADYKIGLRFDSYFSGVAINDVPNQGDKVKQDVTSKVNGRLFIKEFPTKTATVQTIRSYVQRLTATKEFVPDMILVDYADLLKSARGFGEKRHELESVYEELRALSQELNVIVITADQTNRSGLDMEIVTLASISEAYAKATVCDVILTVSRKMEDRQANTGRIFIAKSRLGRDGIVYPFVLNTATVKVSILQQGEDPIAMFMENHKYLQQKVGERAEKLGFNSTRQ